MDESPQPTHEDSAEDLAAEFLSRIEAGESVEVGSLRGQLTTDAERAEFDDLLRLVDTVGQHFPVAQAPGQRLDDRYRLVRELSSGALGSSWLAHDENAREDVTVTVLNVQARELLRNEPDVLADAERGADLGHAGIQATRRWVLGGETPFLVSDFVEGVSLADLLRRARELGGGVPADATMLGNALGPGSTPGWLDLESWARSVAGLMASVTESLEPVHAAGLVHGELTPARIVLEASGRPVITEFGFRSRRQSGGAGTSRLYGAATYLAPEQIEVGESSTRTDVYQLGVMLYELATLHRPFGERDVSQSLARVQLGEITAMTEVATVPPALEDICLTAMECAPSRRYEHLAALRQDLERFLRGETPLATAERAQRGGAPAAASRSNATRAWIAVLVIVAALLAWQALAGPPDVVRPAPSGAVAPGERAVEVVISAPRHVYGLELTRNSRARVVSVRPLRLRDRSASAVVAGTWALALGAGEHVVAWSADPAGPSAVVRMFTCEPDPARHALLERVWQEMADEAERLGRADLPESTARRIFEDAMSLRARGVLPERAAPATFDQVAGSTPFELSGFERFELPVPAR